ncbi:MAG: 50S ribosomal protein P1 [Candidatus Nanoarchaeia archaeon]
METIYAALLLHKAGKQIDVPSMKAVLDAAGLNIDEALIKATVTALKNVDIEKTISEALAAPAVVTAQPAAAAAEAPKKKEEEEKKSEEEAAAGLSALFG